MQLTYTDGPPAQTLIDGTVARRDVPVEVKDSKVAEQLLKQGWKRANKTQKETQVND
jgi:hypothetical protein